MTYAQGFDRLRETLLPRSRLVVRFLQHFEALSLLVSQRSLCHGLFLVQWPHLEPRIRKISNNTLYGTTCALMYLALLGRRGREEHLQLLPRVLDLLELARCSHHLVSPTKIRVQGHAQLGQRGRELIPVFLLAV